MPPYPTRPDNDGDGIPRMESDVIGDNTGAEVEPTLFDNTDSSRDEGYRSDRNRAQHKLYYRALTVAHTVPGGDGDNSDNPPVPDLQRIASGIKERKPPAAGDTVGPDGARLLGIRGKRGEGVFAVVDAEDYERLAPHKWYLNTFGYVFRKARRADGRETSRLLHHDVLPPRDGLENDHVDRDKLNCRRANLRYATRGQNLRNKAAIGTATGLRGVRLVADRFEACVYVGKRFAIGLFDTPKEAALAFDAYARRYFDEFAFINFPEGPLWTVEEAECVKRAQQRQANATAPAYERIDAHLLSNNSYSANQTEAGGRLPLARAHALTTL
jgi:hypothetical protein